MKINEIEPGKKYFSTKATWHKNKMTGKKIRDTATVRVLEVDLKNKKLLASYNGFPVQWYNATTCKHWSREPIAKSTKTITHD